MDKKRKKKRISELFGNYQINKREIKLLTYMIENELGQKDVREDISEYEPNNQKYTGSQHEIEDEIDVRQCIAIRKSLQREVALRELLFSKLSKKEQELVVLRYDKNMTSLEITDKLFISESTYFRRFQKINNRLLIYYEQFEDVFNQEYS